MRSAGPETRGHVIHSARRYDLRLLLRTLGRERAFREEQLALAHLAPGESVLDVGCGTGGLALAARRRVGESGAVHGVDPSPEMVARARRKARRAGADVAFETGVAEALGFPDASFDAVLCTLVLHQLPHDLVHDSLREMRRVLAPGGRLLVVDLGATQDGRRGPHRQGHWDLDELVPILGRMGLDPLEAGPFEFRLLRFERLRYVLAAAAFSS